MVDGIREITGQSTGVADAVAKVVLLTDIFSQNPSLLLRTDFQYLFILLQDVVVL